MGIAAQIGLLVKRIRRAVPGLLGGQGAGRDEGSDDTIDSAGEPNVIKGSAWGDGQFTELSQSDIDRIIGRDE